MDGFALPLVVFSGFMVWLLVELMRGSFDDPVALRAGVTWAITCPLAGLLYGLGLGSVALVSGAISVLALGSLGYWFVATEPDDSQDDSVEETDPDPGPSDDAVLEIPAWARRADQRDSDVDWHAFERLRVQWERESSPVRAPAREPEPERLPVGV